MRPYDDAGVVETVRQAITISDGAADPLAVLTHEAIHAAAETLGLSLSERGTRALESAMVQVLRSNPIFKELWHGSS